MRMRRFGDPSDDRFDIWPGFTDVMVGLLLIFIFVVTIFTITETILSRSLSKRDIELQRLHEEISQKELELDQLAKEMKQLERLFETEIQKAAGLEDLLAAQQKELEAALLAVKEKTDLVGEKDKVISSLKGDLGLALSQIGEKTALIQEKDKALEERRAAIEAALTRISQQTVILQDKEKRIADLGVRLTEAEKKHARSREELSEASAKRIELASRIEALNRRIVDLNAKITGYVSEIGRLNRLLSEAKESESAQKTQAASLQKEIAGLQARLQELSGKLSQTEEKRKKEFRLSQLINLLGEKEHEISKLRQLARYRSEFLARLEKIFEGVADIRVEGDRFVFQSEILFGSARADINQSGKEQLDKFVRIYKEMESKIPPGLDVLILVQGHTDDVPVTTARYRSNWELSYARAMEVVQYLSQKGIPATRLGAAALGEFHPVAKGTSEEARRLNRRIEIKITTL